MKESRTTVISSLNLRSRRNSRRPVFAMTMPWVTAVMRPASADRRPAAAAASSTEARTTGFHSSSRIQWRRRSAVMPRPATAPTPAPSSRRTSATEPVAHIPRWPSTYSSATMEMTAPIGSFSTPSLINSSRSGRSTLKRVSNGVTTVGPVTIISDPYSDAIGQGMSRT